MASAKNVFTVRSARILIFAAELLPTREWHEWEDERAQAELDNAILEAARWVLRRTPTAFKQHELDRTLDEVYEALGEGVGRTTEGPEGPEGRC